MWWTELAHYEKFVLQIWHSRLGADTMNATYFEGTSKSKVAGNIANTKAPIEK